MATKAKLPEIRKEAFTKAREGLGLSVKELSRMACLSVRQIEQIENGESSSFYGPQVKFTAAKKVAGLLKLMPQDAFDSSDVTPAVKASEAEEKLREGIKASAIEQKSEPEKAKEKEEQKELSPVTIELTAQSKSEKLDASKILQSTVGSSAKSKTASDSKKKIFMLVVIGAAVIFSLVNLRPLLFPEPVKEEVVIIQEVAPTPALEPVADAKSAVVPAPEQVPSSAPALVPAPPPATATAPATAPATAAVSAECPAADASPLNYKPDAPKKAGDMVYVQAKTAQTVCVVDASGKTQNKTLEPGVGVSVYGKPPLKVLTDGLNQLDLYYQGAKVRIGNTGSKTIYLEPAEIIQPVAPSISSDSQLR